MKLNFLLQVLNATSNFNHTSINESCVSKLNLSALPISQAAACYLSCATTNNNTANNINEICLKAPSTNNTNIGNDTPSIASNKYLPNVGNLALALIAVGLGQLA